MTRAASSVAFALGGLYLAIFLLTVSSESFSLPGGVVLAPVVLAVWLWVGYRLAAAQESVVVRTIIIWSVPAHAAAAGARLLTEQVFYGGLNDAGRYVDAGSAVAPQVWSGDFSEIGFAVGTRGMEVITGVVMAIVGPTTLTGFLAFSALAWFGLYLLLRTFQGVVPEGDQRLYAMLVLFLPSLLFWPSAIGKDPWLIFCLGLATYGLGRLWSTGRIAVWPSALGVAGAVLVRPHMAMLLIVAMVVATTLGRSGSGKVWSRFLAMGLLAVGGAVVASQVQAFLNLESFGVDALQGVTERISTNTSIGGSQFGNVTVTSLLTLPLGFISVVLRPFPWEAGNVLALGVSLESIALVVLAWRRRQHLPITLRLVLTNPYVLLCAVFTAEFVIGFSNFNNLGLLARERSMLYPYLLVFFAIGHRTETDATDETVVVASTAGDVDEPLDLRRAVPAS